MSVLMRGVDMPKNCEECNFKGECRQYWEKIREAYTRPSWCPLVELADTPQTEYDDEYLEKIRPHDPHKDWFEAEPQTDRPCDKCEWHKEYGRCIFEYCHYEYEQAHKDTPQTDCSWK